MLEVPNSSGGSLTHVSIQVGISDSPTINAFSPEGRSAPFTLLNPTPSDVKNF